MVNCSYIVCSCALARWIIFGVVSLSVFPNKSLSRSANITALYCDNVLVVTKGEYNIDHFGISYAVLNFVVYVCVY